MGSGGWGGGGWVDAAGLRRENLTEIFKFFLCNLFESFMPIGILFLYPFFFFVHYPRWFLPYRTKKFSR